jgi:hypothetical protein
MPRAAALRRFRPWSRRISQTRVIRLTGMPYRSRSAAYRPDRIKQLLLDVLRSSDYCNQDLVVKKQARKWSAAGGLLAISMLFIASCLLAGESIYASGCSQPTSARKACSRAQFPDTGDLPVDSGPFARGRITAVPPSMAKAVVRTACLNSTGRRGKDENGLNTWL